MSNLELMVIFSLQERETRPILYQLQVMLKLGYFKCIYFAVNSQVKSKYIYQFLNINSI